MDATTARLVRLVGLLIAAAFAYAMIDLVWSDRLKYYLASNKFELPVILGGVTLALVVLLQLRALLLGLDDVHDHAHHDHSHGPGHDHDHAHEEVHTHSHDVSLWRLIVLVIPLMILFAGVVPRGLSAGIVGQRLSRAQQAQLSAVEVATLPEGRVAHGRPMDVSVVQLDQDAQSELQRAFWESVERPVRARVKGQYIPSPGLVGRYQIARIRINCCAADAMPAVLTVLGEMEAPLPYGTWVEVTGPISFVQAPGSRQHFAVLHQQGVEELDEPPAEFYLQ